MGRNRKPTHLHVVQNTAKKHPERMRARASEPVPKGGIGSPPKHLTVAQRAIWREIVKIAPPGVLASSDRIALEIAVALTDEYRRDPGKFSAARHRVLVNLLGKLGLSPADRSKIVVPRGSGRNPFGGF